MGTTKRTISVRLDPEAERRLERACRVTRQSRAAFMEKAAEERARRILLDWAVARHREGVESFSELAEETGLAIEEIMAAAGAASSAEALGLFLAGSRAVAEHQGNPEFLRLAEDAVASLASANGGGRSAV